MELNLTSSRVLALADTAIESLTSYLQENPAYQSRRTQLAAVYRLRALAKEAGKKHLTVTDEDHWVLSNLPGSEAALAPTMQHK